jgi:hypothetical protein
MGLPARRKGDCVSPRDGEIWAITSYFNPIAYRRRRQNYQHFRNAVGVPLLVVELSNSGNYELLEGDADIIVRTASGSVLWQKERLLNVALRHLPPHVAYVAWLDCDVIFERRNWHLTAVAELRQRPLIQLFSWRNDLPRDELPGTNHQPPTAPARCSVAKLIAAGLWTTEGPFPLQPGHTRRAAFGLAWAARRELLDKHGFYDAMVIGGGDRAMACAALGRTEFAAKTIRMNKQRFRHYESWATAFQRDVAADVGYLEGQIFHLWHGEKIHRRYVQRHIDFAALPFDPLVDLRLNETGAFEWANDRDDLNRFATEYFHARLEDGA